jgi:hypothetical protein
MITTIQKVMTKGLNFMEGSRPEIGVDTVKNETGYILYETREEYASGG